MKKIELSKNYLDDKFHIYEGYESKVYWYDDNYVIKIFKTDDPEILKNKYMKINLLSEFPTDDVLPVALVYIDGVFKGYVSKNRTDYKELASYSFSLNKKEKELLFHDIYQKLNHYHEYNLIFGDITDSNILYNGKNIIFCDLDNAKIDDYFFDKPNVCMQDYIKKYGKENNSIDSYAFNIFTLCYYYKIHFPFFYQYFRVNNLKGNFNTKENLELLQKTLILPPVYPDQLFIDNTRKRIL